MYTIDTCPNLSCIHCKLFNIHADQPQVESKCKRIDHKKVKFAVPWFKSYDCGRDHIICSDFIPAHPEYADLKEWTCFDDFWKMYVEAWLPYKNTKMYIGFTIGNDTRIRYRVPLMQFISGSMIQNGVLKAEQKVYCVMKKYGEHVLYQLKYEEIEGVKIQEEQNG